MASITELACGCQSSHSCCLRYPEEPQKQIHLSWCFLETQTVRNPPHPTSHPATCYGGLSALREPFKAPKGEPVSRSGLPRGSGMDDLRRKRQMAVRQWSLLSTDCTPTLSGRPSLLLLAQAPWMGGCSFRPVLSPAPQRPPRGNCIAGVIPCASAQNGASGDPQGEAGGAWSTRGPWKSVQMLSAEGPDSRSAHLRGEVMLRRP